MRDKLRDQCRQRVHRKGVEALPGLFPLRTKLDAHSHTRSCLDRISPSPSSHVNTSILDILCVASHSAQPSHIPNTQSRLANGGTRGRNEAIGFFFIVSKCELSRDFTMFLPWCDQRWVRQNTRENAKSVFAMVWSVLSSSSWLRHINMPRDGHEGVNAVPRS